jgi:hypothetical protein
MIGIKLDKEKLRWDLVPIKPMESIIRILMFGAKKYGDQNWEHVPDSQKRYYSACMRHLTAWWDGEKIDPESGESHLAHAAACLLFMLWHEQNKLKTEEISEIDIMIEEIDEPPQMKIRNYGPESISDLDRIKSWFRETRQNWQNWFGAR